MARVAVRPPYGQHPRIFIWGLLEARLQHADLMILGGLNEGVWPALAGARSLAGAAAARRARPAVAGAADRPCRPRFRDRARRAAGAGHPRPPRRPRAGHRLALLAAAGGDDRRPDPRARTCANGRGRSTGPARHRPPRARRRAPDPALRPTAISVTEVDRLKADPYRLLRAQDAGADGARSGRRRSERRLARQRRPRGARSLDEGGRLRPGASCAPRAEALLASAGRAPADARAVAAAADRGDRLDRRPRSRRNRAEGRRPLAAEARGEVELAGVTLDGKADRIDRLADGSLAIVDYKTGSPPSGKAVAEGYSLQLGLLGLIAERGGFDGIEGAAACFEYWSLARDKRRAARLCRRARSAAAAASTRPISPRSPRATSSAPRQQMADRRRAVHRQAPSRICALWRL